MEKFRKYIVPVLCLFLAVSGSLTYLKKGDVVIERATPQTDVVEVTKTEQETNHSEDNKETVQGKVNLNTATSEELQIAPGIGPSKAEAIIKYRTEYGDFKSVDELLEISGIGEKTLAKIRDYYVVK